MIFAYVVAVAPLTGARIETRLPARDVSRMVVAPLTGARIETLLSAHGPQNLVSRPSRARGLKLAVVLLLRH